MRLASSFAAASLALALMTGSVLAQTPAPQGAAPAAPTAPAAAQKQFTESHLALARDVAVTTGIARSFNGVVDQILDQVRQISVTRPEFKDDLEKILTEMKPELEMQQQQITNAATHVFATYLSEAELKDIDAFFKTPSGLKYVQTQPQILDAFVNEFQNWSNSLGEYVMVRVRAELAKRGHKF